MVEQKKDIPTLVQESLSDPNGVIGISGLGRMGPGIAAGLLLGSSSRRLILHDIDRKRTANVVEEILANIKLLNDPKFSNLSRKDIERRILTINDITEIMEKEKIVAWIEAVTETDDCKENFYRDLASVLSPNVLVVTNTSSKNINKLAGNYDGYLPGVGRMLLASHWSNPPLIFPFVEIAPTDISADGLVGVWADFLKDHRWQPIKMNKFIDGYILNAVQFSLIDEACKILDESQKFTPQLIDGVVGELAKGWLNKGIEGDEKLVFDGISLIVANRMRLRLEKTVSMLIDNGVSNFENISLIIRYGLGVRWKNIGMLRAADLGKIDLFAEIHRHLMKVYGVKNISSRLEKMVETGDIGYQPAKQSYKGFYLHDEESVDGNYKNLFDEYLSARKQLGL